MTKEEFKKQVDKAKKVISECIEKNKDVNLWAFDAAMQFACAVTAHTLGVPYDVFKQETYRVVDLYKHIWDDANPSPNSDKVNK